MNNSLKQLVAAFLLIVFALAPLTAKVWAADNNSDQRSIKIISSINPIHQIVRYIAGDETALLLVKGNFSEHNYILKPSDIAAIRESEVIFYVSDDLEIYLSKILNADKTLKNKAVELIKIPNIKLVNVRSKDALKNYSGKNPVGKVDNHIWLDPENAIIIAAAITERLISLDNDNAEKYNLRLAQFSAEVTEKVDQIKKQLQEVGVKKYLVYKDCYGYFENYYGLEPTALISYRDMPTIADVKRVEQVIKNDGPIYCIMSQPQDENDLASKIAVASNIKLVMGDVIGNFDGHGYNDILQNLSNSFTECFHNN